jgi:3-carboxy-cis,cis-muconate lactonizing enzyme.
MATPDNKLLIVANAVGNDLVFLNPVSGQPEGTRAGIEDPYQIGFSPDKQWFLTNCLRLNRVDLYSYQGGRNLQLVKRMPLEALPSHMAFTADSQIAFISLQQTNEVAALHLPTQTLLWTLKVGETPAGVWLTPQDQTLLVALTGADAVVAVDWRKRQVIKRIVTGRAAHNFRSMADGRHVLVSNRVASTISILDMQALTKVGDITGLKPGPDDMELSADRRWLWTTFSLRPHRGRDRPAGAQTGGCHRGRQVAPRHLLLRPRAVLRQPVAGAAGARAAHGLRPPQSRHARHAVQHRLHRPGQRRGQCCG